VIDLTAYHYESYVDFFKIKMGGLEQLKEERRRLLFLKK
jgi:hypothetical protein